MQTSLQTLDYIVFFIYFIGVSAYGFWIYNRKRSATSSTTDYFLAEGSLTWWAIGASLIASNISAEQFIGMSGSGFAMGLAISSYEWMAAATLLVVAVFFLPIFLKNKIYTMPQFLSQRYSPTVATIMAVFWLFLYVFVNLSAILYLGALAINTISGLGFTTCVIGLAAFAVFITLGGMKVIGYTDVIQVFVLILGGLATTYLALDLVAQKFGSSGVLSGFSLIQEKAPTHFHMIFDKANEHYKELPGLTVLIGGMWIANLNYWGCNQYITQRALGADLGTARSGLLFAAFLKMMMPIIVVLPGIAAYVLHQNGSFQEEMMNASGVLKPDRAYPVLLQLLPAGLKGLSFAALTAAIVASLAGKANSISTIFTLDIYKKFIKKDASEAQLISVGKVAIIVAMILGILVAPALSSLEQGFQYIQKYTGFLSPGIFAIFALGFFWKRTTAQAALVGALMTIPTSAGLDLMFPEMPFLNQMGLCFLIVAGTMVLISLTSKNKDNSRGMEYDSEMYKTSSGFAIGAAVILCALAVLYSIYW